MTVTVRPDVSLKALDELAQGIDDNIRDERLLARRIRRLRDGRANGRSWEEVLAAEPAPGTLKVASEILGRLTRASGSLRRILARGLRGEGSSIAAIANRFGVSRQRVSTLLQDHDGTG